MSLPEEKTKAEYKPLMIEGRAEEAMCGKSIGVHSTAQETLSPIPSVSPR
jgi:hypothetical protein